jgi:hypothetical protein
MFGIVLCAAAVHAAAQEGDSALVAAMDAAGAAPSATTKLLWLGGACILYAGADYAGYNATRHNPTALKVYRVFQLLMQGAMSWLLYEQVGLPTALSFNLIWWTFGLDFLYYGYAELINPGHPWESRGDFRNGVLSNRCGWAYWTPVGMTRGMKRGLPIAADTLIAQSLIGLGLALTITIVF